MRLGAVQHGRSTDYWVPSAHLRPFVSALRARGVAPEQVLLRAGLTQAALEHPYGTIPRTRFLQFLRVSQDLSEDPDLGLHAGELVQVDDFDIVGLLSRSSPDVPAVFERLKRYRKSAPRSEMVLQAGAVIFRERPDGATPTPRILGEYFSAFRMRVFSLLTGPVQPIEVRFMHPRPHDTREHERIFHAPLRFEAGENVLVLPQEVMSRALKQPDPELVRVLEPYGERMLKAFAAAPDDLPERVRQLLSEELSAGRVTVDQIAVRMHQSESTLRRQLRESGTSFQTLLDEVRRELAFHYALEPGRSVAEIAHALGFADTGAFYRAFKRWTGKSVAEYRRDNRSR